MHTYPAIPPAYTLIDRAFIHLTRELCRALPPPPTEDDRQTRDEAAIAQVASLHPNSTAEFELAATSICASFRAKYCQVLADQPGADALRWTGKADQMMRQAQSAMRTLLRVQKLRAAREADPKALDRGERAEHHMLTLMTEAISTQPPVSPDDPESHDPQTETHLRHPGPHPTLAFPHQTHPDPEPVSPRDPESQHTETETPPRLPAPEPALRTPAAYPAIPPRPVSSHDPESRTQETETRTRLHSTVRTGGWRPLRPGYDFPLSDLAGQAKEDEAAFSRHLRTPPLRPEPSTSTSESATRSHSPPQQQPHWTE